MSSPTGVPVRLNGSERLLAGSDGHEPLDSTAHRRVHGWLNRPSRRELLADLEHTAMLGRGGAAFPVARKVAAVSADGPRRPAVVVNGSESEPASYKDRTLMRLAPHLVLDGAFATAHALGSRRVVFAVHDEASGQALERALAERPEEASNAVATVVRTSDGFVAGEARAVLSGLSGGLARPPGRGVLPSRHGLDGDPTFLSNVETFAQIGLLATRGVGAYLATGSRREPGTSLLTVLGDVSHPGVVEVPHGTALNALFDQRDGPVLVGGYHGVWVRSLATSRLDRPELASVGAPLGAAVLARLPGTTCALGEVRRVAVWLAAQSVRQCGPCAFGLPAIVASLDATLAGGGVPSIDSLRSRALVVKGRGACSHPDGASRFVLSALVAFDDEVQRHAHIGGCGRPVEGWLPLPQVGRRRPVSAQ